MKKHLSTILVILIFIAGICLLGYPSFSNWWNQRTQSYAIATYQEAVDAQDDTSNEELLAAAEAYNAQLLADEQEGNIAIGNLTESQMAEYESLLDITGTGIMGSVRIPKINVELPIYHGTDEAVLEIAIGHIEGTSLPVGGKGTHAVLSGHRGLPSAKLFTDIDSLGIGDVFMVTVLNRKVTYEVDQILTVLPTETEALAIDPDQDYCTLVTCTPYGINSHRLLVRGHRIENLLDDQIETIQVEIPERELSTQEQMQRYLPYAVILAAGFFGLALILPGKKSDKDRRQRYNPTDEEWEERKRRRDERRRIRDHADQGNDIDDAPYDSAQDCIEYYDTEDQFYDDDEE